MFLHAAVHLNVVKSVSIAGGWIVVLLIFKICCCSFHFTLGGAISFFEVDLYYMMFKTF